ncbi:MAG: holo-ACP synthase [Lachnospiraceae bacterium]|nr:holo-ACP synthase [Lachnospiraceae bacterium]
MVIGVGTDILRIGQLQPEYLKTDDPFLVKTYSKAEISDAKKRELPLDYYATRFAGKEAVFKAFGMSGDHVLMSEIEILNDENGAPHVNLYGNMKKEAQKRGVKNIQISLSYERDYAVAFAVFEA